MGTWRSLWDTRTIQEGIPRKLEHNDIRWITVDEIDRFEFCPADKEIVERLKSTV